MSEEENKAIKSLNDFAYTIHGTLSVGESKTILNLIKNLQKENTLAKETIKNHCSDMDKVNNILAKLQKENEDWQKVYQEEKDKQFDLLTNSIPKQVIKKIRDKAEVMDYYTLTDVVDDLTKVLGK